MARSMWDVVIIGDGELPSLGILNTGRENHLAPMPASPKADSTIWPEKVLPIKGISAHGRCNLEESCFYLLRQPRKDYSSSKVASK